MRIEEVEVSRIKRAAYNPRKELTPTDPEYKKIARSLAEWGLVEPLVWNEVTGNLVGGHMRLKVLIEGGATVVPVSVVKIDNPKREQALNIALNRVAGDWDYPKLKNLLVTLDDGDFDASVTGFDDRDIAGLVGYDGPAPVDDGAIKLGGEAREVKGVLCPSCGHEFTV